MLRSIRYWPNPPAHGRGASYRLHCMFQLILYKPWKEDPDTIILAKMTALYDDPTYDKETFDKDEARLDCYAEEYREFLETEAAVKGMSRAIHANEIKQAYFAHNVWVQEDAEAHEEIDQRQIPSKVHMWQCMLAGHLALQKDATTAAPERETPWDQSTYCADENRKRAWSGWVKYNRAHFRVPRQPDTTDKISDGNAEQRLAYKIIMTHFFRTQHDEKNIKPLRMIIQVIDTIRQY